MTEAEATILEELRALRRELADLRAIVSRGRVKYDLKRVADYGQGCRMPRGHTPLLEEQDPFALRLIVREEVRAETDLILAKMGDRLLSRREVARLAGCSTRTVKRREDEGVLQRVPGLTRAMYHPTEVRRAFGVEGRAR